MNQFLHFSQNKHANAHLPVLNLTFLIPTGTSFFLQICWTWVFFLILPPHAPLQRKFKALNNNNKNCKDGVIECECMLTSDLKVTIDGDDY